MWEITTVELAVEWSIRLVMLFYVPQRRSASAARTWLLLIFLLPWVGLLLYVVIGRIRVSRRRLAMCSRTIHRIREAHELWARSPASPQALPRPLDDIPDMVRRLSGFELMAGNHAEILADYETAIDRLVADIRAAQKHVHLLYYIFHDDDTARKVADALIEAAARGVTCRVLMDDAGSSKGLKHLAPHLREAGVEVIPVLPVRLSRRGAARFDLRNHRKLAVIDGQVGHMGSQNIVNAEFEPGRRNVELVVRVIGPVVSAMQLVFIADRFYETEEVPDLPALFPAANSGGGQIMQLLPTGPGYAEGAFKQLAITLMARAERKIVLSNPYFIPDDAFMEAVQTAARRGIEVHVILPRRADHRFVSWAQQSYYEELLRSGVRLHLYEPGFLHAKHMSVDDSVAVIGSSNLDIRSFMLNSELSLIVYDKGFVAELTAVQDNYILGSYNLALNEWLQRPAWKRMLQNMCRLADSLM